MDLLWSALQVCGMTISRKPYPSDVSDEEWALVAPYLALLPEDAGQRDHSLREAFNGLRYVLRSGCPWRLMPHDLPPWAAVYQQAQRWLTAGCFEHLADDLRVVLRLAAGRQAEPSAVVLDSRTLRSTPDPPRHSPRISTAKPSPVRPPTSSHPFPPCVRPFTRHSRPAARGRAGADTAVSVLVRPRR